MSTLAPRTDDPPIFRQVHPAYRPSPAEQQAEDLAGYYATRAAHDRLTAVYDQLRARDARREAMRELDRPAAVRRYSVLAIVFIALTLLAGLGMLAAEGNGYLWLTIPAGGAMIIAAGGAIAMLSRREKAAAPQLGIDEEVGE